MIFIFNIYIYIKWKRLIVLFNFWYYESFKCFYNFFIIHNLYLNLNIRVVIDFFLFTFIFQTYKF